MKLFHKGLLFLLAVSAVQVILFASFTALLIHSDREQQRARQSQLLVATLLTTEDGIYAATVTLGMLAFERDKVFLQQRFDQLCRDVPERIRSLRKNLKLTPRQSEMMNRIAGGTDLIIALMQECKVAVEDDPLGVKTIRIKRMVDNEIWPHLYDLRRTITEMVDQQKRGDLDGASEERARRMIMFALSGLFLGNILATALIVLGFSRTVTWRLNVIAGNIASLSSGRPLAARISGTDEISLVDKTFHEMAVALTDAAQKDQAVFANMPIGLVTCGSQGTIESLNPKAEELLNLRLATMAEKHFLTLLEPPPASYDSFIDSAREKVHRCQLKKESAGLFPAEVSVAQFQHNGQDRYVVCVEDISEREYAERLRSEVISIVSHDLKTPLNSIAFFLNLLTDGAYGEVNGSLSAGAERAYRECKRLMHLTVDLLDLAALETGNIKLNKKDLELTQVFFRALESVSMFADENGIELEASNSNINVFADEDRLVQILVNFLTNAVKFSPKGSVVHLSAGKAGDDEQVVRISVRDCGRGIPPQMIEQIFQRFTQVRKQDSKIGSGLGLAICKLLADAHGGKVGVVSTEGEGSEFWIDLPEQSNSTTTTSHPAQQSH